MAVAAAVTPAADAPAKPRRGKLVPIAAGLVLLGAGAGGVWWWSTRQAAGTAAAGHVEVPLSQRGLVAFEPFVVNLADPGGTRFVRATVQVVVGTAEQAAEIGETPVLMAQARARILELLATQTADVLVTADGKTALRKTIGEALSGALHELEVVDVLFSDFVVQF
jgi:flagellar FliL protein